MTGTIELSNILSKELIFIILLSAAVILTVVLVGKKVAYSYIRKNRKEIYNKNRALADECVSLCNAVTGNEMKFRFTVNELRLNSVYRCSNSVVAGAYRNEVKYLIKYSNVEMTEECLYKVDFVTDYLLKINLRDARAEALKDAIMQEIPLGCRIFAGREKSFNLICNVKRTKVEDYKFVFKYISPAGKSTHSTLVPIDYNNMSKVREEISAALTKSGHTKTQRSAMTNDLREAIKKRDNYTCQICGNSVYKEPNLLLEVDHIIPVSQGGRTEASNLQTLCWRCNRQKSNH